MALPSIEHLQHQYAKLGLSSLAGPRRATSTTTITGPKRGNTLVGRQGWSLLPGMGPSHAGEGFALTEEPEEAHEGHEHGYGALPPSPVKPQMDTRQPWERDGREGRSVKDERSLRRAVLQGLEVVCDR